MRNRTGKILGGVAAAMLVAGCDPYAAENAGPPSVMGVFATNANPNPQDLFFVDGTGSGAAWSVTIPSTCQPDPLVAATGTVTADLPVIFVKASKLLDGASIETSPQGCQPAGSPPWLTVNPAAPAGQSWFSCYSPGSPSVAEGSSVVLFKAAAYNDAWGAVAGLEGDLVGPVTYTLGGTVRDKQGRPLTFTVTAVVSPAPSAAGATPDLTATEVAGPAVSLTWGNGACAGTPTYTVERTAGLAPGAVCPSDPAAFATLASGISGQAYADPTIAAGQKYCYRVFVSVGTADGPPSAAEAAVPAPPAAPTFSGVTNARVAVGWTAVPGAIRYDVQRALDSAGAPVFFDRISPAAGVTGLVYTDNTVSAATTYWYRIVAVGAGGPSAPGGEASVTTAP